MIAHGGELLETGRLLSFHLFFFFGEGIRIEGLLELESRGCGTRALGPTVRTANLSDQTDNSFFTAAKASIARSKSSRECAAEICVRMRALPFDTTG